MDDRQNGDIPACRVLGTELFFPDFDGDDPPVVTEALAGCARCPVSEECLAGAVARGEAHGIWGGLIFDIAKFELADIHRARKRGDGVGMAAALDEVREATRQFVSGEDKERPWVEAHDCRWCGSLVEAGRHPKDRNVGPYPTCGLVSTYNKGCRCSECKLGKSRYQSRS